jgi:Fe2+ or Zn2+ uptake regulation protein
MRSLPLPEAVILKALQHGGPLSAGEVCRVVQAAYGHELSRTSVYRYLERLETFGLIHACPDTDHPQLWEIVERKDPSWTSIGEIAAKVVECLKVREEAL